MVMPAGPPHSKQIYMREKIDIHGYEHRIELVLNLSCGA
jgi:hypothetical protein